MKLKSQSQGGGGVASNRVVEKETLPMMAKRREETSRAVRAIDKRKWRCE